MGTLDWQPFNMCGVQARLVNDDIVVVEGWENGDGSKGGFSLAHLCATYKFTSRADAYMAAELLNTALYIESRSQ